MLDSARRASTSPAFSSRSLRSSRELPKNLPMRTTSHPTACIPPTPVTRSPTSPRLRRPLPHFLCGSAALRASKKPDSGTPVIIQHEPPTPRLRISSPSPHFLRGSAALRASKTPDSGSPALNRQERIATPVAEPQLPARSANSRSLASASRSGATSLPHLFAFFAFFA